MEIKVHEKKKTKMDSIAESSGSRTLKGMRTAKKKPDGFPRLEATNMKKRRAVTKKSSSNKEKATLSLINGFLARIAKFEKGSLVVSYYVGQAKANELELIRKEAEEMRCWDLSSPKQYEKCHKKIIEFDKRLSKMRGLP